MEVGGDRLEIVGEYWAEINPHARHPGRLPNPGEKLQLFSLEDSTRIVLASPYRCWLAARGVLFFPDSRTKALVDEEGQLGKRTPMTTDERESTARGR